MGKLKSDKSDTDQYILQRVIPTYRAALFERIYRTTGTKVIAAETPPGGTFMQFVDPSTVEWAIPAPIKFPSANNSFHAAIPLRQIVRTWRPRVLVAEFGLRMNSSWELPALRAAGDLERFAFWTHGWQMERGFEALGDRFVQWLRLQLLAKADAIGTYSEEGAEWLSGKLPKIPILPLGNALDRSSIQDLVLKGSPIRRGWPQLLGLGRLTADKRFDLLIEVFRGLRERFPGAALTIIGDGPERAALERSAGNDLDRSIFLPGALHQEVDLAPYFLGADCLLIAGAAGLAVNHALAYGVPVVAFKRHPEGPRHHPEIEYVVPNRSGILVEKPSAAAMIDALAAALHSQHLATLRSRLAHSSTAPSVEQVADQFTRLFAELNDPPSVADRSAQNKVQRRAQRRLSEAGSKQIAFLWDNFGPMHIDRCEAVASATKGSASILGIELFSSSDTYQWAQSAPKTFRKITLDSSLHRRSSPLRIAFSIVRACVSERVTTAFFCHYERPEIFLAALMLRCMGKKVYTMMDSKFDDYDRHLLREVAKSMTHLPYNGALGASRRSLDYLRFLGHSSKQLRPGYNAISVSRIRAYLDPLAEATSFNERNFLVVARLVSKKNLHVAIEAFKIFCETDQIGRRLLLAGAGPLEQELRLHAAAHSVSHRVEFLGFQEERKVAALMANSIAVLLPSVEEQFGLVVAEAQAVGTPVIVSTACGARDELVRTGVNGFIVEPDNPPGWAYFMSLLSENPEMWARMRSASADYARRADVGVFIESVRAIAKF